MKATKKSGKALSTRKLRVIQVRDNIAAARQDVYGLHRKLSIFALESAYNTDRAAITRLDLDRAIREIETRLLKAEDLGGQL